MPDSQPHHALSPEQAIERLESQPEGLTQADAATRLARVGPNELRVIRPVSAWRILVAQLRSVVVEGGAEWVGRAGHGFLPVIPPVWAGRRREGNAPRPVRRFPRPC